MDTKDFFINILVGILIILIVYYLFVTLGWAVNLNNSCYSTVPMTGTSDGSKNYDEKKLAECLKDADEKQRILNLKRSIVSGVLGIALLFNSYYLDLNKFGLKGDVNLGLSMAGLYLILMSITEYFQYIPDIFKFILLIILLFFVLKIYLTKTQIKLKFTI